MITILLHTSKRPFLNNSSFVSEVNRRGPKLKQLALETGKIARQLRYVRVNGVTLFKKIADLLLREKKEGIEVQ